MTDLLTKEERETVERIDSNHRDFQYRWDIACMEEDEPQEHRDRAALLAIIDNLSKRWVKKYSEEELRTAFRAMIQRNVIMLTAEQTTLVEAGWLECARFLGALEEK